MVPVLCWTRLDSIPRISQGQKVGQEMLSSISTASCIDPLDLSGSFAYFIYQDNERVMLGVGYRFMEEGPVLLEAEFHPADGECYTSAVIRRSVVIVKPSPSLLTVIGRHCIGACCCCCCLGCGDNQQQIHPADRELKCQVCALIEASALQHQAVGKMIEELQAIHNNSLTSKQSNLDLSQITVSLIASLSSATLLLNHTSQQLQKKSKKFKCIGNSSKRVSSEDDYVDESLLVKF